MDSRAWLEIRTALTEAVWRADRLRDDIRELPYREARDEATAVWSALIDAKRLVHGRASGYFAALGDVKRALRRLDTALDRIGIPSLYSEQRASIAASVERMLEWR